MSDNVKYSELALSVAPLSNSIARLRRRLAAMTFVVCLFIAWTAPLVLRAQSAGEIETERITLGSDDGKKLEYELGTLFVPENRDDPASRLIGVGFARFDCETQPSPAPPAFLLPGGPGGSYLPRLPSANTDQLERMLAVMSLRTFCDVVLVDQRGFSERGDVLLAKYSPPARKPDRTRSTAEEVAAFEKFARLTVDEYAKGDVDLRGYTVKECAHDVADLAKALGYRKIMLMGTSFGSQWSFAIMRLHENLVARALLSGVEPLDHGYDMPSHVFAAVQRMWRTVDEDPRFQPYLPSGGMAEAARIAIERLEREPLRVEYADEESGERKTVGAIGPDDFPWRDPAAILEIFHGQVNPLKFAFALAGGARERSMPLIGPLIDSSLGVTPQRRYRLWNDPATRFLGRGNFAPYLATAEIWPTPDVGDEFRTPKLSELPVVFAQGDWDTQTPIENTFEIAPFFVNSRVIIAERGGHGVLDNIAHEQPEVWKRLLQFLRTGEVESLPARVRLKASQRFSPPNFPPPLK